MQGRPRNKISEIRDKASILADLIKEYSSGDLYGQRILFKVLVLEIDAEGGKFAENSPRRTIRGKILSEDRDEMTHEQDSDVFWPFLSEYQSVPIKCGEAVWCVYDDPEMKSGWWLWRARDDRPEMLGLDNRAEINRKAVKDTPHYQETENIPLFKSRPDDHTLLGDQGQYLRLGRDRTGEMDSGNDGAVIDLVVGPDSGDVDFKEDKVRFFLAESTNNDVEGLGDRPIAFLMADNVVIVARKKLVIRAEEIEIGGDKNGKDLEPMVKGESLMKKLNDFFTLFTKHNHLTPSGPTTAFDPLTTADSLALQIPTQPFADNKETNDALSKKSKVE